MKSKKELDEIKEEVEKLDTKLHELTEEELEQVTGGGVGHSLDSKVNSGVIPYGDLAHPGLGPGVVCN